MQDRTCRTCGNSFTPSRPNQRFCSPLPGQRKSRCAKRAENDAYRDRHQETATCKGCGVDFTRAVRASRQQLYHSTACQYAARSAEANIGHVPPLPGLLGGLSPYDWLAWHASVAGDPCVYCGGTAEEPDHVVPRAAGGGEDWTNIAPSCKACNAAKHTRTLLGFLMYRATLAQREFLASVDMLRHPTTVPRGSQSKRSGGLSRALRVRPLV